MMRLPTRPPRFARYLKPKCSLSRSAQRACFSTLDAPGAKIEAVKTPTELRADHRKIAIEQELFLNSEYSPGSPIFLPSGTFIFNQLVTLVKAQYRQFGFQEVITPTIYKTSLWEKSGHSENYAEHMYTVNGRVATRDGKGSEKGDNEEYGLKPMNCPGHCLIFASKLRSYRDLPLRYADHSALHRNEVSGALSGLTRVRRFHQDDGHIFCRPSQIGEEVARTLLFISTIYRQLGISRYSFALSTRPKENYMGTKEEWSNAETELTNALEASGRDWTRQEGDGAFYGPKIDITVEDSDGKEHQTATIQLDFHLPRKFSLAYRAPAPEREQRGQSTQDPTLLAKQGSVTPVLIHRAVLGSVERMMALLIEQYNGRWPLWLNPRLVAIITTSDQAEIIQCANDVRDALCNTPDFNVEPDEAEDQVHKHFKTPEANLMGLVEVDDSARTVSRKIQEAKDKQFALIVMVGRKELNADYVTVDFTSRTLTDFSLPSQVILQVAVVQNIVQDWCEAQDVTMLDMLPLWRSKHRIERASIWRHFLQYRDVREPRSSEDDPSEGRLSQDTPFQESNSLREGEHSGASYQERCADLLPRYDEVWNGACKRALALHSLDEEDLKRVRMPVSALGRLLGRITTVP